MNNERGKAMAPIEGEVLPRGSDAADALTISKSLKEWFDANASPNVRTESGSLFQAETKIEEREYWRVADHCDRSALAARLLQGYVLAQILTLDPEGFEEGLKVRGWARSTALDRIAIYKLFDQFGDMKMVSRAAQLSDMRIRLLLPEIEEKGIFDLVRHGESQGLRFEDVVSMSAAQIRKTRAERRIAYERQQLENAAAQGEPLPDYMPSRPDPRWLTTLREEAMVLAWRARAELAALAQVCESLSNACPQKELRGMRAEVGALTRAELQAVQADADRIIGALQTEFGETLDAPRIESRDVTQFKTRHDAVLGVLEVEASQRLSERHRRHRWRGRPAATFKAALASAIEADEKDGAA